MSDTSTQLKNSPGCEQVLGPGRTPLVPSGRSRARRTSRMSKGLPGCTRRDRARSQSRARPRLSLSAVHTASTKHWTWDRLASCL